MTANPGQGTGGQAAGRLGDKMQGSGDAHGCPACPHPIFGPAIAGSPDVLISDRPALRSGDAGMHAACCGPNLWRAAAGSTAVLINDQPAYRRGDKSTACGGGSGQLIEGADDVLFGDSYSGGQAAAPGAARAAGEPPDPHFIEVELFDEAGDPVPGERFSVLLPSGKEVHGVTGRDGRARLLCGQPGTCRVRFVDLDGEAWDFDSATPLEQKAGS